MKVIATNLSGLYEYVLLPKALYSCRASGQDDFTGIWITGLYRGSRTGRMFVETHSIWAKCGSNGIVGTTFKEVDESTFLFYCSKVNLDVSKTNIKAISL